MSKSDAPKRKHVIHIEIQGDTWEDVKYTLKQIQFDLATHEPGNIKIVSGAPDAGYSVTDELYPEQTHDRYFEQVEELLRRA